MILPIDQGSVRGVLLTLAAGLLLAACGGGDDDSGESAVPAAGLRGMTIAIASGGGLPDIQTRFVLQEVYGLDAGSDGADVTLIESPSESIQELLEDGDVDAIVPSDVAAFELSQSDDFEVLRRITQDMADQNETPVLASLLVTYADIRDQKVDALEETNRMLAESVAYFEANQDEVVEAVESEQTNDPDFLVWWQERNDLVLGTDPKDLQVELASIWAAGVALGEIDGVPELESVLFDPNQVEQEADTTESERATVSIAVLDDAPHRAALYAIEQGIVTSGSVDLDLTFLPLSALTEAVPAKQYDIIEASPLTVPLGIARDLDFIVLSGGVLSNDGTLLIGLRRSAD